MRLINGLVHKGEYKLRPPFKMLLSGSSGSGKTTFVEDLIRFNKIEGGVSQIIYHYPEALADPPIQWHLIFKNIPVTYESGIPNNGDYWSSIPKNSLVVIGKLINYFKFE